MSDGEGVVLVGVDLGIFDGVGGEDVLSEGVFFLGSIGDTVLGDVLEEGVADIEVGVADIFESKTEGGFAEHLFSFNLLIIK